MDFSAGIIFQLSSGLLWAAAYWLIINQGFMDKTTGVPWAALVANMAWETTFAFIYPHGGLQGGIDKIWLALDIIILLQFLHYGRQEYKEIMSGKKFYGAVLVTLALSMVIVVASVHEFDDWQGKYAAFEENLMMSILFVSMLLKRGNSMGQSMYIAWTKMVGSLIPAVGFFLFYRSELITVLGLATLLFDLLYIRLLHNYSVEKGFKIIISGYEIKEGGYNIT